MSRIHSIIAGWAIVVGSVGTAAFTFPTISDKASEQREEATWVARASEYEQSEAEGAPASDAAFIRSVAALHTDMSIQNKFQRDLTVTQEFETISVKNIAQAKFQAQETRCLAEAVYYEARSESRSGQKAVAEVILNRVNSKHYPSTICGVVYQGAERTTGCQFSFTCDGSTLTAPRNKSWKRSQAIATYVMSGAHTPITDRATHYHTVDVSPHWSGSLREVGLVGSHKFYRFKWRERPAVNTTMVAAPPS